MRFLRRHALDRRTLLRGAGAALALPWLEAMTPACTRAVPPPRRVAFVYVPNGVIPDAWRPGEPGPIAALEGTLEPLAPHAERLLLCSGFTHDKGRANGDGPGDHARAGASWLTAVQPFKGDGTRLSVGPSFDQVLAKQLGARTRLASLELSGEKGRLSGQCDSGYPCAYSNCISWEDAATPLPRLSNPARVFDRLVGAERGDEDPARRDARLAARASVLDLVGDDARRLSRELGGEDRAKLEQYLDAVAATERRIARLAADGPAVLEGLERPAGEPDGFEERVALLFELAALALASDATRVVSVLVANEGSNRSYGAVEVAEGHHGLSHHTGDAEKLAQLRRIDRHLMTLFAGFLARLESLPEAGGTLLDGCLVLYGSGLSDGNAHRHEDLPLVLAGRLGGSVATGRHVRVARNTPLANLFLEIGNALDVPLTRFGDSSGGASVLSV